MDLLMIALILFVGLVNDESQNEQQGGGYLDRFQTDCYNLNF